MTNVLLTAFEPYGEWTENASWLAMVRLVEQLPRRPVLTTRRFPVDFDAAEKLLAEELAADYDVAPHMGQAPGSAEVALEMIGLNVAGADCPSDEFPPLADDGPAAYRSRLPLGRWADKIRQSGIPARVSYHAGTYLCNAVLYWTHYLAERMNLKTKAAFIHLPLDVSQVAQCRQQQPSMPTEVSAAAVRLILEELAGA